MTQNLSEPPPFIAAIPNASRSAAAMVLSGAALTLSSGADVTLRAGIALNLRSLRSGADVTHRSGAAINLSSAALAPFSVAANSDVSLFGAALNDVSLRSGADIGRRSGADITPRSDVTVTAPSAAAFNDVSLRSVAGSSLSSLTGATLSALGSAWKRVNLSFWAVLAFLGQWAAGNPFISSLAVFSLLFPYAQSEDPAIIFILSVIIAGLFSIGIALMLNCHNLS